MDIKQDDDFLYILSDKLEVENDSGHCEWDETIAWRKIKMIACIALEWKARRTVVVGGEGER